MERVHFPLVHHFSCAESGLDRVGDCGGPKPETTLGPGRIGTAAPSRARLGAALALGT